MAEEAPTVESLSVTAGHDKSGQPEMVDVPFVPGAVTALVGPTGSGKSRFLYDIESIAAGDTPSGRRIFLNGTMPDAEERFGLQGRLVAQLTQNMNFVLDMRAYDFICMHAESRFVSEPETVARRVLAAANELAGESFSDATFLTQLSGGQSRALMIADAALLSWSPVLLIDEIENAGVDKRRALDLLIKSDKIVVIATHDPVLALSADRRLVFRHGAVSSVLTRTTEETALLERLITMEDSIGETRTRLRRGESVC